MRALKMKKATRFLLVLMCLAFAMPSAFAGFGTQEDGTYEGEAGKVNCSTDLDCSVTDGVWTVAMEAAIAPTTVAATGVVSGTQLTASQYVKTAYYIDSTRPASGAPAGTIIVFGGGANKGDCGTAAGGSSFVVCVSDGTNWISINNPNV
jgi:hypothetical protein